MRKLAALAELGTHCELGAHAYSGLGRRLIGLWSTWTARTGLVYGCAHHHGYETNVSLGRIATPAGKAVVLDSADARWRV
jgi:hypothetical protein